jgi:hypothetical protein
MFAQITEQNTPEISGMENSRSILIDLKTFCIEILATESVASGVHLRMRLSK